MQENETKVTISKIDIPFWNLVIFIVKLSLASIPAIFIIWFVMMLFTMIFGGTFMMFGSHGGF
jgi:hypothetical protein